MKNKKKILVITIIFIIAIVVYRCVFFETDLYKKYKYPNEEFFGKEVYSRIDHRATQSERSVGMELFDKVRLVSEYTGTEEDADYVEEIGELNDFYYFTRVGAASQKVDLTFITCELDEDNGMIWVEYDRRYFDEKGEFIGGSSDVLMLWNIEKIDGKWIVVNSREAP